MLAGSLADPAAFIKKAYKYASSSPQPLPLAALFPQADIFLCEPNYLTARPCSFPLYSALEPGGYLEMSDGIVPPASDDGTLAAKSCLVRLSNLSAEAAARLGRPIDLAPQYAAMFEAAGFVDVTVRRFKWPSNVWPRYRKHKELGRWNFASMSGGGLNGLTMAHLTRVLGMSREEAEALCAGAMGEMSNVRIHAYLTV